VNCECQAAWLAAGMSLAGVAIGPYARCRERSRFRVALRISDLGYAAAFDVRLCEQHQSELRISQFYVESEELGPHC
jgi:hypothetical protein